MQAEARHKPKPLLMAERRADAADRKTAHAVAMADRRVEEAQTECDRARADLADLREDRDRWRAQAERLASAIERIKLPAPIVKISPTPTTSAGISQIHADSGNNNCRDGDVLYGVPAIGKAFGWGVRKAYHLKDHHGLPTFNIGKTVCARRGAVADWLAEREACASQEGR